MGTTIQARQSLSDFNALLQHSHIEHGIIYCHCRISFREFFAIVQRHAVFVNKQMRMWAGISPGSVVY